MRAKSMILILIALGCGLVASIGISQVVERGDAPAATLKTTKIYVASANIDINDQFTPENIRLEEWPADRVPEGALTKLEEVKDQRPRQRLSTGMPILQSMLISGDAADNTASYIPAGYRVWSLKVSLDSAVSNLLKPGDRVDVLVFLRKSADIPETGTRTVLRDVRVFAVNQRTERRVEKDGSESVAKTVSLLVKPDHVETLALADQLGSITLSLRPVGEEAANEDIVSAGKTARQLVMGESERADDDPPSSTNPDGDNSLEWLGKQNGGSKASAPVEVVQAPSAHWTMTIYTADGAQQYQWSKEGEFPKLISLGEQSGIAVPEMGRTPASPSTNLNDPTPPPAIEPPREEEWGDELNEGHE